MRRKSDDCRNIQNKSVNEQRKRDAEKSILCLIYCLDYGFFLFFYLRGNTRHETSWCVCEQKMSLKVT